MNGFRAICIGLIFLWAVTACTVEFREKTTTPEQDSTSDTSGSISGSFLVQGDTYFAVRVFAHEVNTGQISIIQTQEGDRTYTIPDLPAGNYWVVGWYYPSGVSGAYTSLDTVMAVGVEEAQACEEAILTIALEPGDEYSSADIGCWGGGFFDIAQPGGYTRLGPNRWKLTELDEEGLIPGSGITVMFEAGKFYGSAGCNNFGGKFTTTPGGGFALNEIEINAMLCIEPPGVMEQEDQFLASLISAKRYITLNKVLELINEDGKTVLRFDLMPTFAEMTPEDLVGITWQLVSAPGLERADLALFTIHFDGKRFSGTTTCRDYAGTYTAANDRLMINYLEMMTDVACEDEALMAEGWYTTLLESTEQYNIKGSWLELYTLKGEKLVFEVAPN